MKVVHVLSKALIETYKRNIIAQTLGNVLEVRSTLYFPTILLLSEAKLYLYVLI